MKLSKIVLPMVGLASVASTLPLTVSCGNSIYDGPVNLQDFIKNRHNFKRTTGYYDGSFDSNIEGQIAYTNAIKSDSHIFIDDLFEVLATSKYWDDEANTLEGNLEIKFKDAEIGQYDIALYSLDAKLNNVMLTFGQPVSDIQNISFDGVIKIQKLPILVWYCVSSVPTESKWRMKIDTNYLEYFIEWSISIQGSVGINGQTEVLEGQIWTWENLQVPIVGWLITTFLDMAHFDIPYFKNVPEPAQQQK